MEGLLTGDRNGFLLGGDLDDRHDGGEDFLLGDGHCRGDVHEQGRLKVVALGVVGVREALAPDEQPGAVPHGLLDEPLEPIKQAVRDHRPDVDPGPSLGPGPDRDRHDVAEPERVHARDHLVYEALVEGCVHDEALNADAVLSGGLESGAHPRVGEEGDVGRVEHHARVLAAELEHGRGPGLGRLDGDLAADFLGADKGEVPEPHVTREGLDRVGQARDHLHELGRVAARDERGADGPHKVERGPRDVLARLDHDRVAGEEGGDDGRQEVVQRVVPADDRTDEANGLEVDVRDFVGQDHVCAGWLGWRRKRGGQFGPAGRPSGEETRGAKHTA